MTTTFTPGMVISSTWLNATDVTVAGVLQSATTAAAARTALGAMAPADQLTGTIATEVTAVTQAYGDSSTKVATTAFVQAASPRAFTYINGFSMLGFSAATYSQLYSASTVLDPRSCYSTGVFTAPTTGYIKVTVGQMGCTQASGTVNYIEVRLKQNATAINPTHGVYPATGGAYKAGFCVIVAATAGDTFELVGQVNGGGTSNFTLTGISFEML